MYNVRVSAEFSSTNIDDPLHVSGTTRREGDLSEIHVADIYRRKKKFSFFLLIYCVTDKNFFFLRCHVSFLFFELIRI